MAKPPLTIPLASIVSLYVGDDAALGVPHATFMRERESLLAKLSQSNAAMELPGLDMKTLPPEFQTDEPQVVGVVMRNQNEVIFGVRFLSADTTNMSDTYMVSYENLPHAFARNIGIFAGQIELRDTLGPIDAPTGGAPKPRFMPAGWHASSVVH